MSFTTYTVDPGDKFRAALDKVKLRVADLRPAFTLIAADFYQGQRALFELTGPGPYEPISLSYGPRKLQKFGFKYPLLVATGRLSKAASVMNGAGNITVIGPDQLLLGVDGGSVPYAGYHQSDAPRRKIPLRKFIFGPQETKFAIGSQRGRLGRWLGILQDAVVKSMTDTGAANKP